MIKATVISFTICISLFACKTLENLQVNTAEKSYEFPMEWIGEYEGELMIFNHSNDTVQVKMELVIDHPNSEGYYPWILTYNDSDIRAYGLEAIAPETGHYRVNEFNSIKLDAYFKGGHFISRFGILGSDLLIDYCKTNKGIEVLLYISQTEEMAVTGGEIFSQDTVPTVDSYRIVAFQKALLKQRKQEK